MERLIKAIKEDNIEKIKELLEIFGNLEKTITILGNRLTKGKLVKKKQQVCSR